MKKGLAPWVKEFVHDFCAITTGILIMVTLATMGGNSGIMIPKNIFGQILLDLNICFQRYLISLDAKKQRQCYFKKKRTSGMHNCYCDAVYLIFQLGNEFLERKNYYTGGSSGSLYSRSSIVFF